MDDAIKLLTSFLPTDATPVYVGITVVISVAAAQLWSWQKHRNFQKVFGKADYRPKYAPMSMLGVMEDGLTFTWDQRFTLYKKSKRELIILEPTRWGAPMLYTNSIEVIRQIGGGGTVTAWWKAPWISLSSTYWGNNVLAENDVGWRKHRRILQPAFNNKTYELVWNETKRLYNEMRIADNWPSVSGQAKVVPHTQLTTQRLALCVILSCGFGLPLGWKEETYAGDTKVNLDNGIKFQADNIMLVCYAPKWLLALPFKKFRYVTDSTNALRSWFNQAVTKKKAEIAEILAETDGDMDAENLKKDVFSRLTLASQVDSRFHLQDGEIIGNTWVMYFAGHETTASILAATFCLLASHKEEQDIVYEEIQRVSKETGDGKLGFEQYDSLVKTRSAFVEALRMFPAGNLILRECREDTVLQVPSGTDADGNVVEEAVFVPKGTFIGGDMVGVQFNPRYFPNPEEFRPSRWYDAASSDDAFTAFSIGPRVCIGRKFALTEGVSFVAHMMRDYEVEPLLEEGETLAAWKERVLGTAEIILTLSIADAPLVFKRR